MAGWDFQALQGAKPLKQRWPATKLRAFDDLWHSFAQSLPHHFALGQAGAARGLSDELHDLCIGDVQLHNAALVHVQKLRLLPRGNKTQ
jgi:hypothetical protein